MPIYPARRWRSWLQLRFWNLPLLWFVGLGLAVLVLWGTAHLTDEVLERETEAIDRAILLAIQQWQSPWLDRLMLGITALGDPYGLGLFSGLSLIGLGWRRRWPQAIMLAIATLGALSVNIGFKWVVSRQRPEDLWPHLVAANDFSFPSGHAMVSTVVYGLVGYYLMQRWRRWQAMILVGVTILVLAIGCSRLYLGVHWPTDVLAGFAAGLVWLITCILSLEVWQLRRHKP